MTKEKKEKKVKQPKDSKIKNVTSELKKVTWPSVKDIFKYTFATIVVVALLTGFFALLNLALSAIKGAVI